MGTSVETESNKSVIRHIQHSILQLCNEHVGYSNKLQILGVLCMTVDDEPVEMVVKVNNTLKRVAPNTPAKDVIHQPPPQPPILPVPIPSVGMPIPQIAPINISPVPSTAVSQNLTQQFQRAEAIQQHLQQQKQLQHHFQQQAAAVAAAAAAVTAASKSLPSPICSTPISATANIDQRPDTPVINLSTNSDVSDNRFTDGNEEAEEHVDVENDKDEVPAEKDEGEDQSGLNVSGEKKSQGRKGRKPTKVHHVYDEGEFISQEDDDGDNVLTVIPTDPDHSEEDMEPISLQSKPKMDTVADAAGANGDGIDVDTEADAAEKSSPQAPDQFTQLQKSTQLQRSTSEFGSAVGFVNPAMETNLPIMRQALEHGAAAAMASARAGFSGYRNHPYAQSAPSTTPGKPSGSASIRALLQAQAQMRQQMRLAQAFSSPIKYNPAAVQSSPSRSITSSPIGGSTIVPINVVPETEKNATMTNNYGGHNGVNDEQCEALDFSSSTADKNANDCDGELIIDESPRAVEMMRSASHAAACTANYSSVVNVKGEGMDLEDSSRVSSEPDDLSRTASVSSSLTSTPVSYHHNPYAYAILDGFNGLSPYAGLNLSGASGLNLSTHGLSPDSGLSIQYTPNGPITVGANGHNVSNSPRVKDLIMFNEHSPLKHQKGNKVIHEGDFMLDKFGMDPKRRRRRSPDETLTAEEIAEYMGATNLGAASSGPNSIIFKCKYCTEEMTDLVRYLQHTLTVHNAYICHQCGKSFTTKSSLLRHRPIHTGLRRFACSICKKTFYRKDKCKSHIKRHLGPGDGNVEQYQQIEPVPEMPELR